jgi:hypothetical protein
MMNELRYIKTRKNGQVECVNIWETGWQKLIVPSEAAFERLQKTVAEGGIPEITGYSS